MKWIRERLNKCYLDYQYLIKSQRPHDSVKKMEKEDFSVDFSAFFDGVMSDWGFQRKNFIESTGYSASPDLWIFHVPKIRPQIGFFPQIGWLTVFFKVIFETIFKRSRFKIVFELWPKIHIPAVQKKTKWFSSVLSRKSWKMLKWLFKSQNMMCYFRILNGKMGSGITFTYLQRTTQSCGDQLKLKKF